MNVGFPVGITSWNRFIYLQVTVVPAGIVTLAGSKLSSLSSLTKPGSPRPEDCTSARGFPEPVAVKSHGESSSALSSTVAVALRAPAATPEVPDARRASVVLRARCSPAGASMDRLPAPVRAPIPAVTAPAAGMTL